MKNVYEVLRQKEIDMERVRKQVGALRDVIPLLVDTSDAPRTDASNVQFNRWPLQLGENRQVTSRR